MLIRKFAFLSCFGTTHKHTRVVDVKDNSSVVDPENDSVLSDDNLYGRFEALV
jgi:hypothetical protein